MGAVEASSSTRAGGVTRRVVVLCLGLAVSFGYLIPIIDLKLSNTYLGAMHLPPGAIAVLLLLLLVINPLLRLLSRRAEFSRNEILTVYISCLFSCLVPGHGAENFFISNIIGPFYYATRENQWLQWLQPHLKPWFTPALTAGGEYNRAVVEPWYVGLRAGEAIPWGAWMVPLLAWGAFIFASYFMLGCLSVMLRAQWAEREALAFPLLRLPLEMTDGCLEDGTGRTSKQAALERFFHNPLMWVGFGIAASVQLLNGLNLYFPDVPKVALGLDTGPLLTEAPWNQIGWTPLQIHPIAVGVAYLLTSEVAFSLWMGFWLFKLQLILAYYSGFLPNTLPAPIGFLGPPIKSFVMYQQVGAYLMYVAFILWIGREHFAHVLRRALGRAPARESEKREALSYPVAFWGFVLSLSFMVAWSMAAGLRADVAVAMWLSYLIAATALTRVVVEGGLLFVLQGWTPLGTIAQLLGSGAGAWLAPSSIVPGAMMQAAMISDVRSFLMPSFVQSFKLAHDRGIRARPLFALIFGAIAITFSMSLWMNVRLGYLHGGLQLDKWYQLGGALTPAGNVGELINGARDVSWINWVWLAAGSLSTYGVMLARSHFPSFPLHPIGLLMGLTHPMHVLWMSIFVGWLCKTLIARFGGVDAYHKATPAFLGMVLGNVAMMLLWLLIDGWQGRTGHQLAL